jgi:hypothetical protein
VIATIAPPSGGCAPVAYVISHARARTLDAPARTAVPAAGALTARLGNLAVGVEYEATAVGTCADGTVTPPSAPLRFTPVSAAAPSNVAWVTNYASGTVSGCIASGTKLTDCTDTGGFGGPQGFTVVGSTAWVTTFQNTVIACTVSGLTLTDCADSGATGLNNPGAIIVVGSTAWVTNYNDGYVSGFTVSGKTLSGTDKSGPFQNPSGIAIVGSTALVTSMTGDSIRACTVSGTLLTDCNADVHYLPAGCGPSFITIAGSTAWVTAYYTQTIYACSISPLSCTDSTATGFQGLGLVGIAIWGSTAWVADAVAGPAGEVTVCTVSGATLSGCTTTGPSFSNLQAIAFSES